MRNELLHKFRKLTLLLILSGSLNILALALVSYWYFSERPPTPICERLPASLAGQTSYHFIDDGNEDVLKQFYQMSMAQLIEKLKDARLVENGYAIRDLALGSLLSFHHFDLPRALAGSRMPLQKRTIAFKDPQGHQKELITYSDIHQEQYDRILAFIQTEQWPLTAQGLFILLQNKRAENNKSLEYAFFMTPEFQAVDLLFKRSNEQVSNPEILEFLLEGSWKMLSNFTEEQRLLQDLSPNKRRDLLLTYIEKGSPAAVALLLKTDAQFAAKKLDDTQVAILLKYSTKRTPATARFALAMLASPRNDKVWKEAASRLYEFAGEPTPATFDRNQTLARFFPLALKEKKKTEIKKTELEPTTAEIGKGVGKLENKTVTATTTTTATAAKTSPQKNKWKRAYITQEKDSLWKISQMFQVDINELKQQNNLTSDTLKPGTMIIVP